MPNSRPNPYVGPRSFRTGEKMYGRERETLELLDLIIAERIVLLYSPSGAGKTSLIQAALLPKLRQEGFNVLPPMRVSSEAPHTAPLPEAKPRPQVPAPPKLTLPERPPQPERATNRFVLSTLLSLEEKQSPEKRLPLPTLARMTFDEYFKQRADFSENSPVLIFDQFEEILTIEPTHLDSKISFFEQIGDALRNRERWALFSMREDYLAGLDPFVKPIPTRFATTYRLDLLGVNAAREAIQRPARDGGVTFTDAAADKLINDLRQVHVQRPDGTMELQPGLYVEPVQLQVVCLRLWNNIPGDKNEIGESDITNVGDVNSALASYYELRVLAVSTATVESERTIREWFDRQLITEQGIRGQVLMEPERSRGLSNNAIRMFEDAHLVRADERRGATWFELAHDRLIEPIRASNAKWYREHLSAQPQQADLWNQQGRPDGLLLRDQVLADAEKWAQLHANELTANEQAFLSECRQARLIKEKELKQQKRIRSLAIWATVLSVIALIGILAALFSLYQLGGALQQTDTERARAVANEKFANEQKQIVVEQDRISKMTAASLAQLDIDPEVSLLLATQAYSVTRDIETDDALRQAVNASHVRGTLRGHTSGVSAVATSDDGKMFATGAGDSPVKLWDALSGKEIAALKGHTATIWSVAFNHAGTKLVSASEDGTARIWDLTKCSAGECPALVIQAHDGPVWSAVFFPNDQLVATGGDDTKIHAWNVADGSLAGTLEGHKSAVASIAISPDGNELLSAGADQTARLWDLTSCEAKPCPFQEITGVAAFWSAAFSPDGKSFVLGSDDQTAYKYDRETLSITNYLSGHTDAVFGVAYSPDGKYIATSSRDGTARIWNANSGQLITPLRGHQDTVWSVAFTPDSKLVLTGSEDKTAKLWTVLNGDELHIFREHRNRVLDAEYSGDGKHIITVGQDNLAFVYDVGTGDWTAVLSGHPDWVVGGALNQDGTRAATSSIDNTVRVWDLKGCDIQCPFIEIKQTSEVNDVDFSPDGKFVALGTSDGKGFVYDSVTGELKATLQGDGSGTLKESTGHQGSITHVEYSPDGKWIVTAGEDGTARVWDVATALNTGAAAVAQKIVLQGHTAAVHDANFNPDATLVVTASDDRTARVWDVASGKELFQLRGHTGPVNAAAFSHDGKFVVTASSDKTARVWDVATQNEVATLRGHTDKIQSAEYSPDDQYILTGSSDRTARITLANIARVLELANQYATRGLSCDEWQSLVGQVSYCPGGGIVQNANALPTLAPITRVAVAIQTPSVENPASATEIPNTPEPTPTLAPTENSSGAPTPTIDILSQPSGGGGGATRTPTTEPTANAQPTVPPPTATPQIAPGVYVSKIIAVPLNPGQSPASAEFHVNFLNTTGAQQGFARWKVLIFEPGSSKSSGETPLGTSQPFPSGASEQIVGPYQIGLGECRNFVAQVVSEDDEQRRTPFLQPNGQVASTEFQLCP